MCILDKDTPIKSMEECVSSLIIVRFSYYIKFRYT